MPHGIVLRLKALHCTTLNCYALQSIVPYGITMHCNTFHSYSLHCAYLIDLHVLREIFLQNSHQDDGQEGSEQHHQHEGVDD